MPSYQNPDRRLGPTFLLLSLIAMAVVAAARSQVDSGTRSSRSGFLRNPRDAVAELDGLADVIFGDGFEGGDTSAWSSTAGLVLPLDGFGSLAGDCNVLGSSSIDTPLPSLFQNHLDFGVDPYDAGDFALLSAGGQGIINDAGGETAPVLATAFAFEVLARCELADLLKTEAEIQYDSAGPTADLLVSVDGWKLGVTVTRAAKFPPGSPFTIPDAEALLSAKLGDIIVSSGNVSVVDAWRKQVLSVIAYDTTHAASLAAAWATLPPELKVDTIVIITVTEGDDSFLYGF